MGVCRVIKGCLLRGLYGGLWCVHAGVCVLFAECFWGDFGVFMGSVSTPQPSKNPQKTPKTPKKPHSHFEVNLPTVVSVKGPEDVLTELVSIPLREETRVNLQEFGPGQLAVGAVLL